MKNQFTVRKLVSAFLIVAVLCSMSATLFSVSAETTPVNYVVSDDFYSANTLVDGTAVNRDAAFALYNYYDKLTQVENATVADVTNTSGLTYGNTNGSGMLCFGPTSQGYNNALYTLKSWPTTKKLTRVVADYNMYAGSKGSRGNTEALCLYFDPTTGESINAYINGVKANGGFELNLCVTNYNTSLATPAVEYSNGNNAWGGTLSGKTYAYSFVNFPDGISIRFTLDYAYSGDTLTSITYNSDLYTDTGRCDLGVGNSQVLTVKNNAWVTNRYDFQSAVPYNTNNQFMAGIRAPKATYQCGNGWDNLSFSFADTVTDTDSLTKASAFAANYASVLNLTPAEVNSENAQSMLDAVAVYKAQNAGVLASLAEMNIDDAKMSALETAAAPLTSTQAQTAFTTYYNAQNIGSIAAIIDEGEGINVNVVEKALRLYNIIEDTHKPNVSAQYAVIIGLIQNKYWSTDGSRRTVTLPPNDLCRHLWTYLQTPHTAYPSAIHTKVSATAATTEYIDFSVLGKDYAGIGVQINSPAYLYDSTNSVVYNNSAPKKVNYIGIPGRIGGSMPVNDTALQTAYAAGTSSMTHYSHTGWYYGNSTKPSQTVTNEATLQTCRVYSATQCQYFYDMYYDNSATTEGAADPLVNSYPWITVDAEVVPTTSTWYDSINAYISRAYFKFIVYYDINQNGIPEEETDYIFYNRNYFVKGDDLGIGVVSAETTLPSMSSRVIPNLPNQTLMTGTTMTYTVLSPATNFIGTYNSVLTAATPAGEDTLNMFKAYNALEASVKADVDAALASTTPIADVLTKANLRPTTNGATIRVNTDQNLAFYTDKPTATTTTWRIKEMGSVICGASYMETNNITALEKGGTGTVFGSIAYGAEDVLDDTVVTYLSGTDIRAKANWGIFIASRSFVVWTDGTDDFLLYSANTDANNTNVYDSSFSTKGMCIRSVNQIIRAIAGSVYGCDSALYGTNKGITTSFTGDTYKDVSYANIRANLDTDGAVLVGGSRDAEATVKMLIAYEGLISAVATAAQQ